MGPPNAERCAADVGPGPLKELREVVIKRLPSNKFKVVVPAVLDEVGRVRDSLVHGKAPILAFGIATPGSALIPPQPSQNSLATVSNQVLRMRRWNDLVLSPTRPNSHHYGGPTRTP